MEAKRTLSRKNAEAGPERAGEIPEPGIIVLTLTLQIDKFI